MRPLCHFMAGKGLVAPPARGRDGPGTWFEDIAFLYLIIQCVTLLAAPHKIMAAVTPVQIGLLCDLSQANERFGQAAVAGARAAVGDINGQDWARQRPLKLIVSDTQGDPAKLLSQAEDLVKKQGVLVLAGPGDKALSGTLRRCGGKLNVPVIITEGGAIIRYGIERPAPDWTFRVGADLNAEIKALYSGLAQAGLGLIAPLAQDSDSGKQSIVFMKAYATESGLKTTPSITFKGEDQGQDLVPQFKKAQREGAVAVTAFGIKKTSGPGIINSAKEAGIDVAMPADMLSSEILKQSQAQPRLFIVAPPILLGRNLSDRHPCKLSEIRFRLAIGDKINSMSPGELLAAGAAWDAVNLAALGIKKAQELTPQAIRDALEDLDEPYAGVMGVIKPTKVEHLGPSPDSLIVVEKKNNALVPIGTNDNLDLPLLPH